MSRLTPWEAAAMCLRRLVYKSCKAMYLFLQECIFRRKRIASRRAAPSAIKPMVWKLRFYFLRMRWSTLHVRVHAHGIVSTR
jgi:hypothetical protein